jgi:hypothetical protein
VTIYQGQIDQLRKLDRIIPSTPPCSELVGDGADLPGHGGDPPRRAGLRRALPLGLRLHALPQGPAAEAARDAGGPAGPELRGKVGLPDDPYAVISTFALFAGYQDANNLTREQFDATIELLTSFKPQVRTVHAYGEEAQLLGRGDVLVDLPSFSGSLVAAREAKLDTAYTLLGAWSYVDCWMVLKDGPNLAGTYAMMDRLPVAGGPARDGEDEPREPGGRLGRRRPPRGPALHVHGGRAGQGAAAAGVTVETDGAEVPFQEWLTAWQQFKG